MKTLIIILMLVSNVVFAQTSRSEINGVLGVKFGSTKAECMTVMKSKGVTAKPYAKEILEVGGVTYGNFKDVAGHFMFTQDKLFYAILMVGLTSRATIYEDYCKLVLQLNEKYGTSESIRNFKTPYKLENGVDLDGIEANYIEVKDLWKERGAGSLEIELLPDLNILIKYFDTKISQQLREQFQKKKLDDM